MMVWLFKPIFLLLLLVNYAIAQPPQMIFATDEWPPFRMKNAQGYYGIDYDFLAELNKRLGLNIKYEAYPWSRSLANMKIGKVDAMSGLAKRSEREAYILYTKPPYFKCSTVFYVRKGDAHLISLYEDLYHFEIGYVLQSAYFERFDKDTTLQKVGVGTEAKLISMLLAKRLHVFIGTDCQADYEIAKRGYTNAIEKAYFKPNNSVDLYLGLSKRSPYIKDIDKINATIKAIVEEGKIKEFADKYYK